MLKLMPSLPSLRCQLLPCGRLLSHGACHLELDSTRLQALREYQLYAVYIDLYSPPPNGHAISLNATKKVQVYHPGYSPPRLLLLFVAYAVDLAQSAPGVPFSTVDDACRIIANNTAGILRVLGTSVDLVAYDNQTQLAPGKYSYYINSATPRYPVCESFHAWSPPPEMPPHWTTVLDVEQVEPPPAATRSNNSHVVKTADQFCIITGESSRLRTAHLVPQAESEWWRHRAMNALTGNVSGIDSPPNCIAVRADLNGDGMDTGSFVFAVFAGKVVVVCLAHTIADFASLNHLREVVLPPRIHPLNLYVRFAWAVFRGSRPILEEFSKFTDAVLVKDTPDLKKTSKKRKNEGGQDGREQDEDGPGASGDNAGGSGQTHQDDVGRGGQTRRAATASYFGITERDLLVAELLDAELSKRPLTNRELMAGMYHGYSKNMRCIFNYGRDHPEVYAVCSARRALPGEEYNEQEL
ncbi:hypothetical protein C8J57DRAFT_1567556 [Mycena rebaudengoi]|nr:hypothetical protein C8J57DRAFT_1567556 [Mycena rebaudengoi]